jgi:hypothetical protein
LWKRSFCPDNHSESADEILFASFISDLNDTTPGCISWLIGQAGGSQSPSATIRPQQSF